MLLGDICTVFSGYAFKNFNDNNQGIPIIKIGNITVDGEVNTSDCQYTTDTPNDKFLSKNGDIYIALSGATTGKIGLMNEDGYYINQRVGIVRLSNKSISIPYLCYFLQSKTSKILNDAAGVAQPNISPKDISKYEFKLRSIEEMNVISNELIKLKKTIKIKQNELLSLDELIKSRFIGQEGAIC